MRPANSSAFLDFFGWRIFLHLADGTSRAFIWGESADAVTQAVALVASVLSQFLTMDSTCPFLESSLPIV